jgi:hypothetical protein
VSELVPELHDLLKLTKLAHDICRWDSQDFETFKPFFPEKENKTWQGVKQHHCNEGIEMGFPTDPDTFYLHIADILASSFSRLDIKIPASAILEEGASNYRVRKLWKPSEDEAEDVRLHDEQQIVSLFEFFAKEPSWKEFVRRYEPTLRNRAEDAHPGKNITSLYTHCKLTGQFCRVLQSSPGCPISQSELDGKDIKQMEDLRKEITSKKWQLMIARCKFHFLQKPYRARDLNVFGQLKDLMEEICSSYPDNVLFKTSDELLLFLTGEEQLSDITSRAQQKGFWVEIVKNRRFLNEVSPNPESMKGTPKYENLYSLPPEITPPICELCQAAKATRRWPEDNALNREICPQCKELLLANSLSSVTDLLCEVDKVRLEDLLQEPLGEDLCETCFNLRARPKLPKLEKWSEEEKAKVAWVRLHLDFAQLNKTLTQLYLASFPAERAEIRFSVIGEFQEDYTLFLQELRRQILSSFGTENVERILEDFFCVKLIRLRETLVLLQIYHKLLNDFFSTFLKLENSPLKISIVCANTKFPFFEVWKTLEKAQEDIFISLTGRGVMRAPIRALNSIVEAANIPYRKSALHKLAKIEETSRTLAELTFQDRRDKDYFVYSRLGANLRSSLDFPSILTFAKLVGD